MAADCGVLLAPGAAARNDVGLGDTLTIQGQHGPLDCTVAGVVAAGTVPVSFISPMVADELDAGDPTSIIIFPEAGIDRAALEADLRAIDEKYGDDAWLLSWQASVDTVAENADTVLALMSGLLVLAVVAAALGLINTTVMSVAQRRRELGLLRAVGATRRQVLAVVSGEAALIGLVGSLLGLIAGVGVGAIFTLAHGGKAWGYPALDLWDVAARAVGPALRNGLLSLVVAPPLSAAAVWLPGRRLLRGSAIETLEPLR
jgi:putative ABC transport system permease protein